MFGDGGGDFRAGGSFAIAHFRDDDELLRAAGFVFQTESDNTAFANAIDARGEFFDLMGIEIAAAFDDDVLDATSDVDFSFGAIRAISGIYPGVLARVLRRAEREKFFGGFGVAIVASGGGRSAEPEKTFGAVRDFVVFFVDDAHFVAQERSAGGHEGNGHRVRGIGGNGAALRGEDFAIDAIDERAAIKRWYGDTERGFRESVHRKLRSAAETVPSEALFKSLQRFRIDRLGAIESGAPGAEIEAFDIFVGDFADTKLVSEIGRGSDGAAMFVERPEPALGTREKGERGHDVERRAVQ